MLDKGNFYIDGKRVAPTVANDFDVIDPSTETAGAAGREADAGVVNGPRLR